MAAEREMMAGEDPLGAVGRAFVKLIRDEKDLEVIEELRAELGSARVDLLFPGSPEHSFRPYRPYLRMGVGGMNWSSAAELVRKAPESVPWLAKPWLALGSITELVGPPKAAGKTTFLAFLIRQILDGLPFLDESTLRTPVVFLTEQSRVSFAAVLRRAGLADREDLSILTRAEAAGVPWEGVVTAAVEEAARKEARLMVVDTASAFSGVEDENDAVQARKALLPLQEAVADGQLAALLSRHDRKSGGPVGESGRGSSAYTGAVDIVLALRRHAESQRPTIRKLEALSRFDETPAELMIELTEDGYVSRGSRLDVAMQEARAGILSEAPHSAEHALDLDGFVERVPGLSRTTAQRTVAYLLDDRQLERVGTGKKGSPYRFFQPAPPADGKAPTHSAQGPPALGGMSDGKGDPVLAKLREFE